MAKKKKIIPANTANNTPPKGQVQPLPNNETTPVINTKEPSKPWSIYDFKTQAIIVAVLAFVFYINSAVNEFAHDDGIVIVKNEYVQEGLAGIPKIFSKDAYDSYYRQLNTSNQLSGGRYRPLSIATFAVEQQLFGAVPVDKIDSFLKVGMSYGVHGDQEKTLVNQMHVRHVLNVLWYVALVVVLLYFLRYIVFKNDPMIAFLAALIFTIHPIHTEVVANVKSRDEIMSLLFMCTTFIFAFKFEEQKKKFWLLGLGTLSFFLAFLSKEYAITLVILLPMAFYLFNNYSLTKSIAAFLPYMVIVGLYFFIRYKVAYWMIAGNDDTMTFSEVFAKIRTSGSSSEQEILNNPYYYATPVEKLATEIATCLNYLKLLIFPHPLSADYSYDTIPYKNFSNFWVYCSLIIHGAMLVLIGYFGFFKKNLKVFSFAIAFYLFHLFLVCNIFFDIGATMGERLIFHSSVGFAIVVAYLLYKGFERIQPVATGRIALIGLMSIITVLCGAKTIARNFYWKNDNTLFTEDLKVAPNSILVNANVAASYVSMADYEKDEKKKKELLYAAIAMLDKTIYLHKHTFVAGFLNRGIAWYKLGDIDKAKANMDTVKSLYPTYPTLKGMYALLSDHFMKRGWNEYGKFGKYPEAIEEFKKGLAIDSSNAELWYNMGGAYYSNHQIQEAIASWQVALKLKPDYLMAQQGMQAAMGLLNSQNAQKAH